MSKIPTEKKNKEFRDKKPYSRNKADKQKLLEKKKEKEDFNPNGIVSFFNLFLLVCYDSSVFIWKKLQHNK